MEDDIAIKVKNLSKTFVLPHEKRDTLKSFFVNPFKKIDHEKQVAFHNLSFEIKKGEFFGIVGRNGSGKSTLLKCIAGVYTPNSGSIHVNGTLVPFIELGVGFNPELSGKDNVFLNGALLGFSRKQMAEMYDDIVDFAELEKFMDQKLKNYSSGMQVRLAFSIAIRARGDILLLDEVLAVGDTAFQQKCYDYFHSLKENNKTIILVSHSMSTVEQFCDRALLLEQGEIKKIGSSTEVAELYETMFRKEEVARAKAGGDEDAVEDPIILHEISTWQDDKKKSNIQAFKPFEIRLVIESKVNYKTSNFGINIKNHDRVLLVSTDTRYALGELIELKKGKKVTISFTIENLLTNGVYTISLGAADCSQKIDKLVYKKEGAGKFSVSGVKSHTRSLMHPEIKCVVE